MARPVPLLPSFQEVSVLVETSIKEVGLVKTCAGEMPKGVHRQTCHDVLVLPAKHGRVPKVPV